MSSFDASLCAVVESTDQFPVDFDQAWRWVGYARKDVALRALTTNFVLDEDFSTLRKKVERAYRDEYHLTIECFKAFCMMAGTEKGEEVRTHFIEIEKRYRKIEAGVRGGRIGVVKTKSLPSGAQLNAMLKTYGPKEMARRLDYLIGYPEPVKQSIKQPELDLGPALTTDELAVSLREIVPRSAV